MRTISAEISTSPGLPMTTAVNNALNTATAEISVDSLALGMYVAELDRPWLETPFLFQGFKLTEQEEIDTLRNLCKLVHVLDPDGSIGRAERARRATKPAPVRDPALDVPTDVFRKPGNRVLDVKHPMHEEMAQAKKAHGELVTTIATVMDGLRSGRMLDIDRVQAATHPLINSIGRNPDALAWLSAMRQKDMDIYNQSVSAAVLILTFGRHLGLPRIALDSLALGGLLFDVGKTRISDDILLKPDRLSETEFTEYKKHVQYGMEILSQTRGLDTSIIAMVRTHHERHDGSGYANGLKADEIPAFGKIAGIVDAYQTMLSLSNAGKQLSPHRVLNYLNRRRDMEFESALVEEFIQAIGIYPTGTLVELSDGRIGVVIEQNRRRRLQPKVMLLLDASKNPLPGTQTIDLVIDGASDDQIQVINCLEPGAYGIDTEELFL